MEWLAWFVVAALVAMTVVWLVRRFRTENRRIDGMLRDFDRENPRQEPAFAAAAPSARRSPPAPIGQKPLFWSPRRSPVS
jgi:hypothetical protein